MLGKAIRVVEQSSVQFGGTAIPYTIKRGRRVKTVAVGVDPIEGVYVRAPKDTPIERLDKIVHRKAKWIVDRRLRHGDLPPPSSPREFVSGETFLYLGRQYRLKVLRGRRGVVRLVAGRLQVPIPAGSDPDVVRERLVTWYRAHAERRLPERVAIWAPKLGLEPKSVLIRDQRKRWGSADSNGNVRFNWRVVQAPMGLVDYVVAHELIHLQHQGHTRAFWAALGQVMNDYEERREALRQLGRVMVW